MPPNKNTHVYLGPVILAPVVQTGDKVDPKNLPEALAKLVKEHEEFKALMVRPAQVDATRTDLQILSSEASHNYRAAVGILRRNG